MRSTNLAIAASAILATGCVFDGGDSDSGGGRAADGAKLFSMGQLYASDGGTSALDRIGSDSSASLGLKTWATSDVVLGADSTGLYVLERTNAVVSRYDQGDFSRLSFQVNVGAGSNPYAVAASAGKVWVACYGSSYLKAIDPVAGKLVDSIDLSRYADTAHHQSVPQMLDVHAVGSKLAVVLGRLNGWDPGDSSVVLVLDPATKAVERRIALPWKNAYGTAWNGDSALVSCTGAWGVLDGGVALVDLRSGTARAVVSEKDLGDDPGMVAFGPRARSTWPSATRARPSPSTWGRGLWGRASPDRLRWDPSSGTAPPCGSAT